MIPSILLLSPVPGRGSGAEQVLLYLLEGGRARFGDRLTIAAPPGSRVLETATRHGYPTVPWDSSHDALLPNVAAALRFRAPRGRFDLVHAWNLRSLDAGLVIGTRAGLPRTASVFDAARAPWHGPFRRLATRAALPFFRAVAFASAATSGTWNLDAARSAVVHAGLPDCPLPSPLPEGSLKIGFLGCYAPWKGIGRIAALVEETTDLDLRWNLYGALHPAVAPAVNRLRARYPGRVAYRGHRDIESICGEVALIVHPSQFHDPFPTVLLEAARAGLPVLASRAGGTAEIVADDETGLLFAPDDAGAARDALRRLAADSRLRARLGAAARRRYEERFTSDRLAADYAAFWSGAVSSRSR